MAAGVAVAVPAPAVWEGRDVDLTTVERQIGNLWKRLAEESSANAPVRTHVFNLVVYADSEETADRVRGTIARLTQRHPSRSIILVADRWSQEQSVDAQVSVGAEKMAAAGLPLGHEEIVLRVHGRAADHLASVVVPLILTELPTYLWWPGQPPFGHRVFHDLLSIANHLVIDSAELDSPGDAFGDLSRLCGGVHGVNDFHWRRIAPWRDVIAQFFDGPAMAPYARAIRSARLEFGAGAERAHSGATAGVLLVAGWMASRLGWEPDTTLDRVPRQDVTITVLQGERVIPIDIRFRPRGKDAAGRLMKLEMVSQPPDLPPARFSIQRTEDLCNAEARTEVHDESAIARVVQLALKSDEELLNVELDLSGQDSLYSEVVGMAARLAGRQLWGA